LSATDGRMIDDTHGGVPERVVSFAPWDNLRRVPGCG
jgi:hypothetical protein